MGAEVARISWPFHEPFERFLAKCFISMTLAWSVPAGSAEFISHGSRPPLRSVVKDE
jgi:hypothetical protein